MIDKDSFRAQLAMVKHIYAKTPYPEHLGDMYPENALNMLSDEDVQKCKDCYGRPIAGLDEASELVDGEVATVQEKRRRLMACGTKNVPPVAYPVHVVEQADEYAEVLGELTECPEGLQPDPVIEMA